MKSIELLQNSKLYITPDVACDLQIEIQAKGSFSYQPWALFW